MAQLTDNQIEHLIKLFIEIGVKSATMDEIALKLGISKKTLYTEFSEKNELVKFIFLRDLDHFSTTISSISRDGSNAIVQLCALMNAVVERQESASLPALYNLKKYYDELFCEIFQKSGSLLKENIEFLIRRGVKEEIFRKEINPIRDASILQFFIESYSLRPFVNLPNEKVPIYVKEFLDIFLRGISTQKGNKILDIIDFNTLISSKIELSDVKSM